VNELGAKTKISSSAEYLCDHDVLTRVCGLTTVHDDA